MVAHAAQIHAGLCPGLLQGLQVLQGNGVLAQFQVTSQVDQGLDQIAFEVFVQPHLAGFGRFAHQPVPGAHGGGFENQGCIAGCARHVGLLFTVLLYSYTVLERQKAGRVSHRAQSAPGVWKMGSAAAGFQVFHAQGLEDLGSRAETGEG